MYSPALNSDFTVGFLTGASAGSAATGGLAGALAAFTGAAALAGTAAGSGFFATAGFGAAALAGAGLDGAAFTGAVLTGAGFATAALAVGGLLLAPATGLVAGVLRTAAFCAAGTARLAGEDFTDAADFAAFATAGFSLGLVITNLYVPSNMAPGARTWLPSRRDTPQPARDKAGPA